MVELGKSRLPLEEDLIKKKIEFVKSWLEWATNNRLQTISASTSVAGSDILFTVPENNTLFITGAFLSMANTIAAITDIDLRINSAERIFLACSAFQNAVQSISLSFPMPLKAEAGDIIRLSSNNAGAGVRNSGGIVGFVEPKKIS